MVAFPPCAGHPPSLVRANSRSFRITSGGFDLSLSADQLKALDEASRIDLGFPYDLYAKEAVRAVVYGGMRGQIVA
jgi:hypothetical protein